MREHREQKGFTLVEMVVAVAVLATLMASIGWFFVHSQNSFLLNRDIHELNVATRLALEKMKNEVNQILDPTNDPLVLDTTAWPQSGTADGPRLLQFKQVFGADTSDPNAPVVDYTDGPGNTGDEWWITYFGVEASVSRGFLRSRYPGITIPVAIENQAQGPDGLFGTSDDDYSQKNSDGEPIYQLLISDRFLPEDPNLSGPPNPTLFKVERITPKQLRVTFTLNIIDRLKGDSSGTMEYGFQDNLVITHTFTLRQ